LVGGHQRGGRKLGSVKSRDGTMIAFDELGEGLPLVLVDGAMCYRQIGPTPTLANALRSKFRVYTYDRRGRGESSDGRPYSVAREIEDLEGIIAHIGGSAFVYGLSSGAALALLTAAKSSSIKRLALYEPPYLGEVPGSQVYHEYGERLGEFLAAGQRGNAVELFLSTIGVPDPAIARTRQAPVWALMESIAHTLAYDNAVLGDGSVPLYDAGKVNAPTLVLAGGSSPEAMRLGAKRTAAAIPNSQYRTLEGQTHDVSSEVLAPVLMEFFQ
jgi:pimeloyl-ACP methyl ester carboxylesterase